MSSSAKSPIVGAAAHDNAGGTKSPALGVSNDQGSGVPSQPSRLTLPLFSKRARQIQVDEGITPAPYRPPAMRDGPSPPTQDINGLRQVKGRARAGTLPSSWASTDQQRSSSPLASRLDAASEADSNSDFGDAMGRSRSSSTVSAFGAAHNAFSSGLGAARSGTDLHNAAIGPPPGLGGLSSASRIRSGSLTLPSSGFDNAFGPSIFSSWQPNRSGLSAGAGGSSGSRVGNMGNDDVRSLQSNDALDGTEAHVRTLDYLGLADVAPFSSSSLRPAQSVTHSGRSSPLGLGLSNAQLSMPSRHRASTLSSTARPRPSAAAAAARTRSSSFITSGVQEGLIEDNEDELVDQEGPGSYTPVSSAYQNSLASAALHNRLGQLSGTSTDYNAAAHAASSAAAAATRPRAISMGVLDNPQNGQQGMNYGLGNDSFSDEDIYAAYAIEHGLDPAAFAAAAAAAGLPPLSRSGQQGGNAHGRHRAGTVATVPGGPGGRQRNEQELLRMAKMMSGPGSASMLAGDAPSYFNVAPSDAYMPSGVPSGGASPSLHRTSSSASISGLGGSGQPPSRSLWIGNLDPGTTGQELMQVFAPYGAIESLRLLPEKECGFVNFVEMSDAIRARDDVLNRLGGKIGTGGNGPNATVRIGFGKVDSAPSAPGSVGGFGSRGFPSARADGGVNTDGYPGTPGEAPTAPTRALWVGSIPSTTTPAVLLSIFTPFGPIESARVLTHKNCGFVNFERVDDAIRARKALNGRDVLGSEVGAVRIGFAKVPVKNADEGFPGDPSTAGFAAAVDVLGQMKGASTISGEQQALSGNLENYRSNMILNLMQHKGTDAGSGSGATSGRPSPGIAGVQNALAAGSSSASIAPSSDKGGVPLPSELVPHPTTSEQQLIMRELSEGDPELQVDVDAVADLRPPAMYYTNIPLVSEVSSSRRFDTTKLREMRKSIDGGQCSQDDIDAMARDFMDDIVDLSSDYIGNTVVQKFFERCSEQVKQIMLERIAPHLAMIGIHKNGTWAAQKIIDCSKTPEQIALIAQNLAPYVPPLLLDQFGNYVVQCVIPYKSPTNEFVFNAMVDRCWEVAQGRFGARSMRACLENSLVTKRQQKRVAIAIILNSVPLATSPNGALLLTWLLDTSGLPGRYRLLAPRFAPHLSHLCNHKLASLTVLRIINQKAEPSASRIILKALFDSPHDQALEEVLTDQVHGSQCITKVLSSQAIDPQDKPRYADAVKRILIDNKLVGVPAYRRLVEDLGLPVGPPLAPRPNQDLRGAAPLAPQQAQFTGMLPPHTSYPADLNSMLAQMQGLQLQQGGQSLAGMMPAPNLGQGSGLALGQQGFGTSPIRLDSANSNAQNYLSSSNTDPFSPFARGNAGVDFSFNPVRGQASPPRGARRGGRGQNSSPIGGHGGFAQPSLMEHYLQNGYPQQGPNFP